MTWREFQRKQRVTELGDRFLSYVDEGNGPPLILIHGIPAWGYVWSPILPALGARARVLVPDLLGFGFSDKRDCFDRSLVAQAAALESWIDKLGLGRVTLAGHGIGGSIALRLAILRPSKIERLCLLNAACYDSWPDSLMLFLGNPQADRRLSSRRTSMLLRRGLKKRMNLGPNVEEFTDGVIAPYSTEVGKLSLMRDASALNTNLTTELTHRLQELRLPCLIIWGEDDQIHPVKYGERLAADIPGARLVRIKGARHFVMVDNPEIVAGLVLQFLPAASARDMHPLTLMKNEPGEKVPEKNRPQSNSA